MADLVCINVAAILDVQQIWPGGMVTFASNYGMRELRRRGLDAKNRALRIAVRYPSDMMLKNIFAIWTSRSRG